jgi:hypothetical protein
VVDLTEAYDDLAALVPGSAESAATVRAIGKEQRQLRFSPVTAKAAADLRMDQAELKTYLATRLARHLTGDSAVKLVQFHPSYTHEDFFEGFRPQPGAVGGLTFTLRPEPFVS